MYFNFIYLVLKLRVNNTANLLRNMDLGEKIEAVLYASENPLSADDIAFALKEDRVAVATALKKLIKEYNNRKTSLCIVRTGIRYKLQLKSEFSDLVIPVSKRELDKTEIGILGFIAANDNCKRGDILQKFGEKSREILQRLESRKLLSAKKYRNTELFSVTKEFFRYFNIDRKSLKKMALSEGKIIEGEGNAAQSRPDIIGPGDQDSSNQSGN